MWKITVFSILLIMCGCSYLTGKGRLEYLRLDQVRPYADSIEIQVSLSDTVVQLYHPDVVSVWHGDLFYPSETTDSIYLTVCIKNTSARTLNVPKKSLDAAPCRGPYQGTICYIWGREDETGHFPLQSGYTIREDVYPSHFTELPAGAERIVLDSLKLFSDGAFPLDKPGRFWLFVKFQNHAWEESKIPYWTGEVWSDTVRFSVIE